MNNDKNKSNQQLKEEQQNEGNCKWCSAVS